MTGCACIKSSLGGTTYGASRRFQRTHLQVSSKYRDWLPSGRPEMEKLMECICGILSLALLTLTWARLIRKGTRWELPTHFTGQPFKYSEPANYLDIERKGRSPMIFVSRWVFAHFM